MHMQDKLSLQEIVITPKYVSVHMEIVLGNVVSARTKLRSKQECTREE